MKEGLSIRRLDQQIYLSCAVCTFDFCAGNRRPIESLAYRFFTELFLLLRCVFSSRDYLAQSILMLKKIFSA